MASNNSEILGELDGEIGRNLLQRPALQPPGIKDKVRGVKNSAGEVVDMKKGVILVLFAMLLLAGCGTTQHKGQSGDESRKGTGEETLVKEGTFVGLADQHTVAVNIDGKETTFQVPPNKRDRYKGIKDGTKVEVEYTKAEDGTLQLEDMKKKE
ncbi:membrane bound lipoprotein [Bacillus haynesii]|uniref:membrane bound lipoprotein n=2 Tax=Bacillus haynesii TaxID=1925021 RepID=UPI00227E10E8|nr:membrane bound lipoprotein [Bacillus haynesii]MCY7860014.1 membrane bound lipoprotein [Bacillus haynesii]MCY8081203.1 membrane bound lipoprotein [Bacillus haynesii]MCY8383902.1 membrane bound lipoprotein [Bacillus haynesii]MCY8588784.1 membrane bound lipoprotein [Bacillus haynesii]